MKYPLVSDLKREISKKYNVLTEDGVALRGLFIVDKEVGSTAVLEWLYSLVNVSQIGSCDLPVWDCETMMSKFCRLTFTMHLTDLYIALPRNVCRCCDLDSIHWLSCSRKHYLCSFCVASVQAITMACFCRASSSTPPSTTCPLDAVLRRLYAHCKQCSMFRRTLTRFAQQDGSLVM